jgi:hypothetical protein
MYRPEITLLFAYRYFRTRHIQIKKQLWKSIQSCFCFVCVEKCMISYTFTPILVEAHNPIQYLLLEQHSAVDGGVQTGDVGSPGAVDKLDQLIGYDRMPPWVGVDAISGEKA